MKKIWIGFDQEGNIVDGNTTLRQLEDLFSSYMLNVRYYHADVNILDIWSENRRTMGNILINDRRKRIDEGAAVPGCPPLMVATVDGVEIVRLEWYEGEEKLELKYDLKHPRYDFNGPSYTSD
ncbi:hypothetical protein [Desulfolucanica intricata]|uniref:hypothetical protein n=1 Tax=Desulfolucanica intricata TaxID=1285191 RepID=UPI00082B536D|nr:hypothetical protein [Desulfolucanica intricata]